MLVRRREGALTTEEERIVKSLLAQRWRNQDIQALVNIGRKATINSARISEVKQNDHIRPVSDDAVEFFKVKKHAYDPKTLLNFFEDERLIRAREAMILAVQIFNSPTLNFKTEVFAVLANIAWTYLLHEFYVRRRVKIVDDHGRSLLLSKILRRPDCPLSDGVKRNLSALKIIRDEVEHTTLGKSDLKWLPLFQACCLNFDKMMCDLFGGELSLQKDLAFALQFARMNVEQLSGLEKYEIPGHIEALDARLTEGLTEEQMADLEYQFRVVYTLDSSSKSRSHVQFFHPDSDEAQQIRNVLVKYKPADDLYPYKPNKIAYLVAEKSGKPFNLHNHTQAWRKFKARPRAPAANPENTNKEFCIYHPAHGDYTYSEKWLDFLISEISTERGYQAIQSFQL
jgi:hypothetical protein